MKAYTRQEYGGPEVLQLSEVPIPEPASTEVSIQVKANSEGGTGAHSSWNGLASAKKAISWSRLRRSGEPGGR